MRSATKNSRTHLWGPATGLGLALVVALGLSACSSSKSDSSSSSGSGSGSASADSILGPEKKATLSPVNVGIITEGKTAAVDNSAQVPLAKATAKYINEHLGGLGGHTMNIIGCEANGTPQGATDCTNQLIQANVVATLSPQYGESGQVAKAMTALNIPVIEYQAGTPDELTSPHSYSIGGGIISLAGSVGADLLEKKLDRVAILMINLPAVTSAVTSFAAPAYKKAGSRLTSSRSRPVRPI
jgi:branched-chain amino acid transport system substrate-binding protein